MLFHEILLYVLPSLLSVLIILDNKTSFNQTPNRTGIVQKKPLKRLMNALMKTLYAHSLLENKLLSLTHETLLRINDSEI